MDDDIGKIKVIPDYFHTSTSEDSSSQNTSSGKLPARKDNQLGSNSCFCPPKRFRSSTFMLNLLSLKGLPWASSADGQEKVEVNAAELASLRSQLADLEEREAHFKAQLEHVDEILRSSRLSGYLHIRTRWTALPGEPPPIDDMDVDDWLPRFVVLHGSCLFFYLYSTDLSPQDSTLLSDIVEVGALPCFTREDEIEYCFYALTRQGLRYECSSVSKIQVDSWVTALQAECKSNSTAKLPNGSTGS